MSHGTWAHVVWTTKKFAPVLSRSIRQHLIQHLSTYAQSLNVEVKAIGGWRQHIHLLIRVKDRSEHSDIIRRMKGESSHWLNQTFDFAIPFRWQHRYWSNWVSPEELKPIKAYIAKQEEHHD